MSTTLAAWVRAGNGIATKGGFVRTNGGSAAGLDLLAIDGWRGDPLAVSIGCTQ